MIVVRRWRTGLLDAVRPVVDYGDGVRFSRYMYGDCDWPDELAVIGPALVDDLDQIAGVRFTHVLVQGYRDETASTPWHSDDNFDAQAILSIGATRRLGVARLDGSGLTYHTMSDGDLAFMPSGYQKDWQHSVPAESEPCGERLSLVFRTNR